MIEGRGIRKRTSGEKRIEEAGGRQKKQQPLGWHEGPQELGDAEAGAVPMKNDAQSTEHYCSENSATEVLYSLQLWLGWRPRRVRVL